MTLMVLVGMRFLKVAIVSCCSVLAACAGRQEAGTIASTGYDRSPKAFTVTGQIRVASNVDQNFPCTALAPFLDQEMQGGLKDCRSVALEFTARGSAQKQIVFDLWLVSEPSDETADQNPVVDFYEDITLGEMGDTATGRFSFKRYRLGQKYVVVFDRQLPKR